jgi:hypothetical protein
VVKACPVGLAEEAPNDPKGGAAWLEDRPDVYGLDDTGPASDAMAESDFWASKGGYAPPSVASRLFPSAARLLFGYFSRRTVRSALAQSSAPNS